MDADSLIEYYCDKRNMNSPVDETERVDILRRMVIIGLVEQNEYDEYVGELDERSKSAQ